MSVLTPISPRSVPKNAETQMRTWSIGQEVRDRIHLDEPMRQLTERIRPYLAISRETGAGGGEIARKVAERLGWEVLDKELLTKMADQYHLSQAAVETVDENEPNWLYELIGKWLDQRLLTQSEYVLHLGRLAILAAREASRVFVGRGVQFVLPRDRGVSVQIIAPFKQRVEWVMHERGLSHEAARRFVVDSDDGRRHFIQRYFHRNVTDPRQYDIVLNREHVSTEEAVDVLVEHMRRHISRR